MNDKKKVSVGCIGYQSSTVGTLVRVIIDVVGEMEKGLAITVDSRGP
jgi:hypothetical protein